MDIVDEKPQPSLLYLQDFLFIGTDTNIVTQKIVSILTYFGKNGVLYMNFKE